MKKILGLTFCFVLLAAAMSYADSLYVGGTYTSIASVVNGSVTTEGGGSVGASSLDGRPLDYLYCVDLFTNVYVNSTYPYTTVNTTGTIHGKTINNVGEVAWLLGTYGTGGQGDQAIALQAAIWTVINGPDVYHLDTSKNSASLTSLYNEMLHNGTGKTGTVSDFLWINPGNDAKGTLSYQGLVTAAPIQPRQGAGGPAPTPEPATMLLFGAGLAGLAGMRLRKKE